MGFAHLEILRRRQYSVSVAANAANHTQCSESFIRKQIRSLRCPLAGKPLFKLLKPWNYCIHRFCLKRVNHHFRISEKTCDAESRLFC